MNFFKKNGSKKTEPKIEKPKTEFLVLVRIAISVLIGRLSEPWTPLVSLIEEAVQVTTEE